jgi:hypothetical protein
MGTAASFYLPTGVAVDCMGTVYVADRENNVIRKILHQATSQHSLDQALHLMLIGWNISFI